MKIAFALDACATGRGEVGPEWRFRLAVPGEPRRPPEFAPTVAVEVLSPRDDRRDIASKIDVYFRAGTELVIAIDPAARTVALHDRHTVTLLSASDVLRHVALPEFALELGAFFASALDRR